VIDIIFDLGMWDDSLFFTSIEVIYLFDRVLFIAHQRNCRHGCSVERRLPVGGSYLPRLLISADQYQSVMNGTDFGS